MEGNENRPARKFHLDLLRAIACLSVVMIHVSADFVVRGNQGPDFWWGNLFDSLARTGVPLFVMISGALMLDENYGFTVKKWVGHIVRMAVFYVVWKVICALIGSPDYHLWFVPMIIGVYLTVPMLRLWVNEQNVCWVKVFLMISLVFAFVMPQAMGIVPGVEGVFGSFMDNFNLGFAPGYIAYFVLGWYLNRGGAPLEACGRAGNCGSDHDLCRHRICFGHARNGRISLLRKLHDQCTCAFRRDLCAVQGRLRPHGKDGWLWQTDRRLDLPLQSRHLCSASLCHFSAAGCVRRHACCGCGAADLCAYGCRLCGRVRNAAPDSAGKENRVTDMIKILHQNR